MQSLRMYTGRIDTRSTKNNMYRIYKCHESLLAVLVCLHYIQMSCCVTMCKCGWDELRKGGQWRSLTQSCPTLTQQTIALLAVAAAPRFKPLLGVTLEWHCSVSQWEPSSHLQPAHQLSVTLARCLSLYRQWHTDTPDISPPPQTCLSDKDTLTPGQPDLSLQHRQEKMTDDNAFFILYFLFLPSSLYSVDRLPAHHNKSTYEQILGFKVTILYVTLQFTDAWYNFHFGWVNPVNWRVWNL